MSLVTAVTATAPEGAERPQLVALAAEREELDEVATWVVTRSTCSVLVARAREIPRRITALVTSADGALLARMTIIAARLFGAHLRLLYTEGDEAPATVKDQGRVARRLKAILAAAGTCGLPEPCFEVVPTAGNALPSATDDTDLLLVGEGLHGGVADERPMALARVSCSVLLVRPSRP